MKSIDIDNEEINCYHKMNSDVGRIKAIKVRKETAVSEGDLFTIH